MCGIGEAKATGEHTGVAGEELARVERNCADLGLRDADLDAATNQARVKRVVVAVKAQVGLRPERA